MMRTEFSRRECMRGLSLVEVMVAITISLILLGGAITLFINNKVTYQSNDNISRLQENARFAIDFLQRDLRLAGYYGCNPSPAKVVNTLAGPLNDTTSPLEGVDDTNNPGAWSPSGTPNSTAQILPNTDALTIRHLSGTNRIVIGSTATTFTVESAAGLGPGQAVVVSDCNGSHIFPLADVDHDTDVLTHAGLSRAYDSNGDATDPSNPRISGFVALRYFVGDGNLIPGDNIEDNLRFLYREVPGTAPVRLIEGVENMQLLFGVDNTGDNVPDTYLPANDAALNTAPEWESVVSVRISLLMRTTDEYGQDVDTNTYQLNDFVFPAQNDRFKRRVFNTTVLLRNRLTG